MYVLALTGGLGSGKTTAAAYFESQGAVVIDLDAVAARLLRADSSVRHKLVAEFGPAVSVADGSVDPAALAREAFADPGRVSTLNSIMHPAIADEVERELSRLRSSGYRGVVVLEVPLIVEAPHFAEIADEVLAVQAPEALRIARAVSRGMTPAEAHRRIRNQASDEARAELADHVIVNDGEENRFFDALERVWLRVSAERECR